MTEQDPTPERATHQAQPVGGFLDRRPIICAVILIALFTLAAAARTYRLDAPGVLVDRDFSSAIIARDVLQQFAGTDPREQQLARVTRAHQPILEPPVTEWLVASVYSAAGREDLRLARLVTSAMWLLGGLFLFRVARALVSTDAAVIATGFYLLSPLGILLSRSFQPDSLMMLLFLISLDAIVRYFQKPSLALLWLTAAVSAVAIVYRPLILFATVGAFTFATIQRHGVRNALRDPRLAAFIVVSMLPALAYYGQATWIARHFEWKFQESFRPSLLWHWEFWRGWRDLALMAVGYTFLVAGCLGAGLLRSGLPRAIVAGMTAGYCAFGLTFTMHIHTHGYYHAQLIPIIAIAAGPLALLIASRLPRSYRWVAIAAILMLGSYATVHDVRAQLRKPLPYESPTVAQHIGRIVRHSTRVVFLAPFYGQPLQYYAGLTGAYWPRALSYYLYLRPGDKVRTLRERLDGLGFVPEYFVITAMEEYRKNHRDLRDYLEHHCRPTALTNDYLIYEGCTTPEAPGPAGQSMHSSG